MANKELDDFLKKLFIDNVKGCLGKAGDGGDISPTYDADGDGVIDNAAQLGGISADQYALKSDIESSVASDEDADQIVDSIFGSTVATEEEVDEVIDSVFN